MHWVENVVLSDLGHAHDVRNLPVHITAAVADGLLLARRRIERLHHLQPCRQPITLEISIRPGKCGRCRSGEICDGIHGAAIV